MENSSDRCVKVIGEETNRGTPESYKMEIYFSLAVSTVTLVMIVICLGLWCYRRRIQFQRAYAVMNAVEPPENRGYVQATLPRVGRDLCPVRINENRENRDNRENRESRSVPPPM